MRPQLLHYGERKFNLHKLPGQRICGQSALDGLPIAQHEINVGFVLSYDGLFELTGGSSGLRVNPFINWDEHVSLNPGTLENQIEAKSSVFQAVGAKIKVRSYVDILESVFFPSIEGHAVSYSHLGIFKFGSGICSD